MFIFFVKIIFGIMNFKKSSLTLAFFALALLGACRKKQQDYLVRITVDDAKTSRIWTDTTGKTKGGAWEIGEGSAQSNFLGGAIDISSWSSNPILKNENGSYPEKDKQSLGTFYPSSLTPEQVIEQLSSRDEINENDAVIKNIEIKFIDKKGKEVVLAQRGELKVGESFVKGYPIPRGVYFSVEAIAEQTGETIAKPKENWWASGEQVAVTVKDIKDLLFPNGEDKATNEKKQTSQTSQTNQTNEKFNPKIAFVVLEQLGEFRGKAKGLATSTAKNFANEGTGKRLSDARVTLKIEVFKNGTVVASQKITQNKFAKLIVKAVAK